MQKNSSEQPCKPLENPFFPSSLTKINPFNFEDVFSVLFLHGGLSLFVMDDGYVGGPPHILFPAILRFEQQIKEECNLTLQRSKCEVYTQSGDLPEDALPGFIKAGEEVDGVFLPGFMCVGAPLGSDEYVAHMMRQKVGELREEVEATVDLLAEEKQALWTCLRASLSHKLEYWLGLLYPSQAEEAAREVDQLYREVMEKVVVW